MKTEKIFISIFFVILMFTSCFNGKTTKKNITENKTVNDSSDVVAYPIVGTGQSIAYDNTTIIPKPSAGQDFYGQNANYPGTTPSYTDNGDGTVTDNVTGLIWQNTLDHNGDGKIDIKDKLTYDEILEMVKNCKTGGYTDWRLPTIKEQYSLMNFNGKDVSGYEGSNEGLVPFINTKYFGYNHGDTEAGERILDVQCASSTLFVGNKSMIFGVNLADGRIKGYGKNLHGKPKKFNYLLVRGNTNYGKNSFTNNGDGTVTDKATGLMWMQEDSKKGMIWKDALNYAENFSFAGHSDWRLPDAKELQSLVDYSRSPQTTSSAAIDPLFKSTNIKNEAGNSDYPFYWSSTTHAKMIGGKEGGWGVYLSFGRAMGNFNEPKGPPPGQKPPNGELPPPPMENKPSSKTNWVDVHGAGAQRSDPKDGDISSYSSGHGPQGDAVRIYNYVRLVRNL